MKSPGIYGKITLYAAFYKKAFWHAFEKKNSRKEGT